MAGPVGQMGLRGSSSPSLPGVAESGRGRQRSKATGSSKPFPKWPFIQPWPFRPLQLRRSDGT